MSGLERYMRNYPLFSTLREMQGREELTDTLLITTDHKIAVHAGVLGLHPFWKGLLDGLETPVVMFPDWAAEDIEELVSNMYNQMKIEIIKIEPSEILLHSDTDTDEMDENAEDSMNEDDNIPDGNSITLDLSKSTMPIEYKKCFECEEEFSKVKQLKDHMKLVHAELSPCWKCNKLFASNTILKQHKKTNHGKIKEKDLSFILLNEDVKKALGLAVKRGMLGKHEFICQEQEENGVKCLEQFLNQDALRHHISNKHVLGLYYCCKCDKQLNNRVMKFTHVKSKHSKDKDEKGKFECKSCGKRFKSAYYLKTHSRKVHSDDIKNEKNSFIVVNTEVKRQLKASVSRGTVSKDEYTCQEEDERGAQCSAAFQTADKFHHHLSTHHLSGLYHCTLCDKQLNNRAMKHLHMKKHASENYPETQGKDHQVYSCDICEFSATNKHCLNLHRRNKHEASKEKSVCDICLREYTTLENMLDHKRKIHEGEGFPCETCGKTFRTLKAVSLHAEIHAGSKHPCYKCGKEFSSQQALTSHSNNYHGPVQEYVCQYCGKISNIYVTHKRHQETHTGEKPFKCDICQTAYDRKHKLDMHKKTHSDNKEFECDICQAKFKVYYVLKRHKVIHKERRHKCHMCKFAAHQSFDLTRHYRSVHAIERPKETYLSYKNDT